MHPAIASIESLADLGPTLARGSRSTVHLVAEDLVAKVPLPSTPRAWIRYEATYTADVREVGVAVPQSYGVKSVDGTLVAFYQRIIGHSWWDLVSFGASAPEGTGRRLAQLHADTMKFRAPITLPMQRSRLETKLREVARREPAIAALLPKLSEAFARCTSATALCHGDFHPKNVIESDEGPVIVDWFDASRGTIEAEVARTKLLLAASSAHLLSSDAHLIESIRECYVSTILDLNPSNALVVQDEMDGSLWTQIAAAARMAEGVDATLLRSLALAGLSESGHDLG